eukprot:17576-Eustigmatos_ZCMA.PRE.1
MEEPCTTAAGLRYTLVLRQAAVRQLLADDMVAQPYKIVVARDEDQRAGLLEALYVGQHGLCEVLEP